MTFSLHVLIASNSSPPPPLTQTSPKPIRPLSWSVSNECFGGPTRIAEFVGSSSLLFGDASPAREFEYEPAGVGVDCPLGNR